MGRFYRGRGGRQGRGGNRNNRKVNSNNTTPKKKSLEDYTFYIGSSKQASDFETTNNYIINHIKKEYKCPIDISESLRLLQTFDANKWKPKMDVSTETDPSKKAIEEKENEIVYKAEVDKWQKRRDIYKENLVNAYALIWERCAKSMQDKVERRTDFSKIHNDPVLLLKAIKQHALDFSQNKYEMSTILDALRAYLSCRQRDDETLSDYTKRFKTQREVLHSHMGSGIVLQKVVRAMPGFDPTDEVKVNACIEKADEQFATYLYLQNSDQDKYSSILRKLMTDKSLKQDLYPKTMADGGDALSNHTFDDGWRDKKDKKKKGNKNRNDNDSKKEESKEDSKEEVPTLSFAQLEGKCYCCGKAGHKSPQCNLKEKIPKDEWAIHKAQAQMAHVAEKEKTSSNSSAVSALTTSNESKKSNNHVGWAGVHYGFTQPEKASQDDIHDLSHWILLDSDSNATVFCKKEYVDKIWDVNSSMNIQTNGNGAMVSKQKCIIPHLGEHWFNENSMTNIISLAHMADKYRITMDTKEERALLVHMPGRIVKFKQMDNRLYAMDPRQPEKYIVKTGSISDKKHLPSIRSTSKITPFQFMGIGNKQTNYQFVETVEDNLNHLSPRQQTQAKRARRAYQALGTPTPEDFKAIIRMNLIKDNKVTTADVNLAEKTFGPDIGAMKGKHTRTRPKQVIENSIEIPSELLKIQAEVTLSIDGLTVNGIKFLTTISHDVFYRTAQYLPDSRAETIDERMTEVIGVYKKGEFRVAAIHCDNEFRKSMDPLSLRYDPAIKMNYANAGEHVPRAERNNRTLQETVRTSYYQMPYQKLPRTLIKYMVMEAPRKRNYFPAKHGVSKYFSPRMILHKRNLDWETHCTHILGEYVQAEDDPDPKNTNAPRMLDCLYLRPTESQQGGHELLHLQTNSVIKRAICKSVPLTPSILKQVHAIADQEGMPEGLKIHTRTGVVLFDSASTAGVEYDEEAFDEYQQDPDYEENNEQSEAQDEEDDDDADMDLNQDDYDELDPEEIADLRRSEPIVTQNRQEEQQEEEHEIVFEEDDEEEETEEEPLFHNYDENEDEDYEDSEQEDVELQVDDEQEYVNRYGRRINAPERFQIHATVEQTEEYSVETAHVIGRVMMHLEEQMNGMNDEEALAFIQTYSLKGGIKKWGEKAEAAATKEMKQLDDRTVFEPISIKDMTPLERKRAMESLLFLVEKRDGTIKARACANGSVQREYIPREEATSPTAATEAILITGVIEAKQERDVMTLDVPNAFVQTTVTHKEGEKIVMKIRGELVNILLELNPHKYENFVVYEKGKKVLYVKMLKALYGMLISSILYYKKFRKDIEDIGFHVNPYDVCVANREVNGKQQTVTWHVDDLKSSHVDPIVNDEFHKWAEDKYGSEELGHVKVVRGPKHDYLAMILDYSEKGVLKIDMKYYIEGMLKEFPHKVGKTTTAPWTEKLFKVNDNEKKLDEIRSATFHTFVMKAMFLCKRARPDIEPVVNFLATRTREPTVGDWKKLLRMMAFLNGTINDVLRLAADELGVLYWYIDASFAVHQDMKSHTGSILTMGYGAVLSGSTKQKVNSRSSTEAELNGVDDRISKVLWTKRFIEHQGHVITVNIIYQDNTSTIKLEENGKASSGKRTRHFDIKLFYVTDLVGRDEVQIKYCPTDKMIADYMTKPLVGKKFKQFRTWIMNL